MFVEEKFQVRGYHPNGLPSSQYLIKYAIKSVDRYQKYKRKLITKPTDFMEQSPWEADITSFSQLKLNN